MIRESVDLADVPARAAFLDKALEGSKNALVLTEGLLVYLGEGPVRALADELYARPQVRTWIIDLASPGVLRQMQKAPRKLGKQPWGAIVRLTKD